MLVAILQVRLPPVPQGDDTRRVRFFIRMKVARETEVANLQVAVMCEQQVWKFEIP